MVGAFGEIITFQEEMAQPNTKEDGETETRTPLKKRAEPSDRKEPPQENLKVMIRIS